MTDGPYKSINIYSEDDDDKKYSLKLTTEPDTSHLVEIGTVEFNTVDDSLVLANHGLQTGQKIRLNGSSGTGWGNVRQRATSKSDVQTHMDGGNTTSGSANFNLDGFVVSSTGTSFQFADADGGSVRKFELFEDDPITTSANANVKVYKYAYEASSSTRSLTLYNNGSTGTTLTNSYFKSTDVGRLIRINPLMKAGSQIGGIKWCWGIIKTVSNSVITVEFKTEMSNTRDSHGTSEFRLGAFSDGEGWPHVAQIYQQRMVLAANTLQPSTIWLSETAQFYSFAPTVLADQGTQQSFTDGMATEIVIDSSALTFTLDSDTLDSIKWLAESKKLTMGTSAGVYMLYGAETNLTVTPFRFTINRETSFSATDTAPIVVSNALLYAQIGGKDVQSLELEGGTANQWLASKISMKGYDIIKSSEIKKMVWQERPNNLVWFMMADGRLLTLSYDRGAEFKAWSEHVLGGSLYRKIILTSQSTSPKEFTVSTGDVTALSDTTPTPSGAWQASQSHTNISPTSTSGSGTGIKFSITTNGAGNPTVSVTTGGKDYAGSDTIVITDPGSTSNTATVTVSTVSSTILITDSAHGLLDTNIIQITTEGTVPTGLSLSTNYYVRDKTTDTYRISTASGGSAISHTDDGSGTHKWHKPTIYTVDGDNSSLYTVDENVVLSGYSISDWNSTQRVMAVTVNSSTDTEITTDFDSFGLANTTEAVSGRKQRISDENSANAQVVDMEMIPTASHDQIWFKVKRTIDGVDKYYIETLGRFPTEGALTRNQYVFSDSSVKGSVGTDKIINSLAHLKNEEVQVYYEGMQHVNKTVTATGSVTETITLNHTQGNEHVTGLPYDAELETLEPSAPENQFSYTKRLIKIAVLVEESLGIQLEYNDLSEELLFRTTVDAMGRQIPLFSGLRKLSLSGIGWDTHNLKVVSNGPFPMQLNAIIIEAETGGS